MNACFLRASRYRKAMNSSNLIDLGGDESIVNGAG
jgi:hypothetical protein